MRGDQAQKQIALFNGEQAVLERTLSRYHWHGTLMRHPYLVTTASQDGVDALQQFLDAVNRRGNHNDEFIILVIPERHLIHRNLLLVYLYSHPTNRESCGSLRNSKHQRATADNSAVGLVVTARV